MPARPQPPAHPRLRVPDRHAERRSTPRFPAQDALVGYLTSEDLPVRIRDLGLGGFSIETIEPLEAGIVHDVRFIANDDWTTTLKARAVYCKPSVATDGLPRFATGFSFIDAAASRPSVESLLERVTKVHLYRR